MNEIKTIDGFPKMLVYVDNEPQWREVYLNYGDHPDFPLRDDYRYIPIIDLDTEELLEKFDGEFFIRTWSYDQY